MITRMPKKDLQAVLIKQTAQRYQQQHGLPAQAAEDHARVCGPVAEAALGRCGGAGKDFRARHPGAVGFPGWFGSKNAAEVKIL